MPKKKFITILESEGVFFPKDTYSQAELVVSLKGLQTCVGLVVSGEKGVYIAHVANNNPVFNDMFVMHIKNLVGIIKQIWITEGEKISKRHSLTTHEVIFRPIQKAFDQLPIQTIKQVFNYDRQGEILDNDALSLCITLSSDSVSVIQKHENLRELDSIMRTLPRERQARYIRNNHIMKANDCNISYYLYDEKDDRLILQQHVHFHKFRLNFAALMFVAMIFNIFKTYENFAEKNPVSTVVWLAVTLATLYSFFKLFFPNDPHHADQARLKEALRSPQFSLNPPKDTLINLKESTVDQNGENVSLYKHF